MDKSLEQYFNEHGNHQFLALPPTLVVWLQRFRPIDNNNGIVKTNERYEFNKNIDLSNYLPIHANGKYTLLTVISHQGTIENGHYVAFINKGKWYKYNDSVVTDSSEINAIENNFGTGQRGEFNAYMLIYEQNQ